MDRVTRHDLVILSTRLQYPYGDDFKMTALIWKLTVSIWKMTSI